MQEYIAQPDSPTLRVSPIEHDSDIDDFFAGMARAITRGDLTAVTKCWAIPSFVMGEEMSMVVKSANEVRTFFQGAKEHYNSRGIFNTVADINRVQWVTDNIALVEVRWPQLNAQGEEIGEEISTYSLKKEDDGDFKIHVAITHGERNLTH